MWEEGAAKHVSLAEHLEKCAALATRWRRAEMRSWAGLLETIHSRHAAKSHRAWFSLYALLAGVDLNPETLAVGTPTAMEVEAVEAEEGLGAPTALASDETEALKSVAEGLQELMQGCSVGEYQRRLETLWYFYAHLQLTHRVQQQDGTHGEPPTLSCDCSSVRCAHSGADAEAGGWVRCRWAGGTYRHVGASAVQHVSLLRPVRSCGG